MVAKTRKVVLCAEDQKDAAMASTKDAKVALF